MKRSEIDKALQRSWRPCARKTRCYLPPFCHFTPEEWKDEGPRVRRSARLHARLGHHRLRPRRFRQDRLLPHHHPQRQPHAWPDKYPEGLRREAAVSEGGPVRPRTTSTGTRPRTSSTAAAATCLIRVYNSLPNEEIDYESDVTGPHRRLGALRFPPARRSA